MRQRTANLFTLSLLMLSAFPLGSAFAQTAKEAKKAQPTGKQAIGKGLAKAMAKGEASMLGRLMRPDPLPANVEKTPVTKAPGRKYVPLSREENLGKPIDSETLDRWMADEMASAGVDQMSPAVSDDRFVRRLYLDVIGRLPSPADIQDYVNDKSLDKRSKLIEKLLALPQFGENWARYWQDTIAYRNTAGENRVFPFAFETWLAEQWNQNKSWREIVSQMLVAEGEARTTPQGILFGAHDGKPEELAGEISRIFMGLQISCAQCHDHPSDVWKRDQFHDFAAFFSGVRVQLNPQERTLTIATNFRTVAYRKPDAKDPTKFGEVVTPVFLTGQTMPTYLSQQDRRKAAAQLLTSKKNLYFSKAFVNRVWAELVGRGFVNPVDDLGAQRPVAYPKVFEGLSKSFAASDYDIKQLFRTILNSKVYDRVARESDASTGAVAFQNVAPTRLSADQILNSLDWILNDIDDNLRGGGPRRPGGARQLFRLVFGFDPSNDPTEIEGSITQAMAMMNNTAINGRIQAERRGTLLNKLLQAQSTDEGLIDSLYLRVLARKPTAEEVKTCLGFFKEVGNRQEAAEDVLWALLNSTEFLNNH